MSLDAGGAARSLHDRRTCAFTNGATLARSRSSVNSRDVTRASRTRPIVRNTSTVMPRASSSARHLAASGPTVTRHHCASTSNASIPKLARPRHRNALICTARWTGKWRMLPLWDSRMRLKTQSASKTAAPAQRARPHRRPLTTSNSSTQAHVW